MLPQDLKALEAAAAKLGGIKHHLAGIDEFSIDMWSVVTGDGIAPACPLAIHHPASAKATPGHNVLPVGDDGTEGVCPTCRQKSTSLDFFAVPIIGGPRYDKHGQWEWDEEEISLLARNLSVTLAGVAATGNGGAVGVEELRKKEQTRWKEAIIAEIGGPAPDEPGRASTLKGHVIYERGRPYKWVEKAGSDFGRWEPVSEKYLELLVYETARNTPAAWGKQTIAGVQMTRSLSDEIMARLRRFVPQIDQSKEQNLIYPHHAFTLDVLLGQQFADGVLILHGQGGWEWDPESRREQIFPLSRSYPLLTALNSVQGRPLDAPTGVQLVDDWLLSSFPEEESRRTALEIIGSLAYGRAPVGDRKIFLYLGAGGAGKSVLCDLLFHLLPPEAIYSGSRRLSSEQYFEARVDGKELMLMREYRPMTPGRNGGYSGLDASEEIEMLKRVTGDTLMMGRDMYEKPSKKNMSLCQVMLVGNKDPDFGSDAGDIKPLQRRLVALRASEVPLDKQHAGLVADIAAHPQGIPRLAAAGMLAYNEALGRGGRLIEWTQGRMSQRMSSELFGSPWDAALAYVRAEESALMPNSVLQDLMLAIDRAEDGANILRQNDEDGKKTAAAFRKWMKEANPGIVFAEKITQRIDKPPEAVRTYMETKLSPEEAAAWKGRCWSGLGLTEKGQFLLKNFKI